MFRIIDSHCHVYPEKIADKATAATGNFYDIPIDCRGTVNTLKNEMEAAGIEISIIQSVATSPKQVCSINNFIADEVKTNTCFLGLGTLHPDSENIEKDVDEIVSLGLKGVKLHPDIQNFKVDDERCLKIYECCEQKKLPILIHTGDHRYDNSNPNRLKKVLEMYEELIIIGAHFGGWSIWKEAAKELHKYKNLYVDTSSSLYAIDKGEALEILTMYGEDKVLFATDFPMWNPKEELERFMNIDLTDIQREKILFHNANELFNL